jgi:hypothetical protein
MFKQIKNKYAKEEFLLDAGHHPDLRHVVKIQHSGIICTSPGGGSGWAGMTGTCHTNN